MHCAFSQKIIPVLHVEMIDMYIEWMKYDFSCFFHLDQGRRSCPGTSCIISRKLTIIASIIWTICLKSELTTALYLGPFFCFLYLYQQVFFESPEIQIQLSVKTHSTYRYIYNVENLLWGIFLLLPLL